MNAAEAQKKVTLGRIGEVASRLVRFFFRKRKGLGKIFGVRVARIISGVGQEGVALCVVDDLDGFGFHLQLQDRDTGQRKENEKNQRHEEIEANGRHVSLRAPFAKGRWQFARLKQQGSRRSQDPVVEIDEVDNEIMDQGANGATMAVRWLAAERTIGAEQRRVAVRAVAVLAPRSASADAASS